MDYGYILHPPGEGGLTLVSFPIVVVFVSFIQWSWSGRVGNGKGEKRRGGNGGHSLTLLVSILLSYLKTRHASEFDWPSKKCKTNVT